MKYISKLFLLNIIVIFLFQLTCIKSFNLLGSEKVIEEISESKGFLPISMVGLNPLDKIFYFSFDIATMQSYKNKLNHFNAPHFTFGIKHSLRNTWFLGFNVGTFNTLSSNGEHLSYLKFAQEISYPFNLYYPVYAIIGLSVGYAIATKSWTKFYALDLHSDRENTLFFSGFITFLYYYSPSYSYFLRWDLNQSSSVSDLKRMSIGLGIMATLI